VVAVSLERVAPATHASNHVLHFKRLRPENRCGNAGVILPVAGDILTWGAAILRGFDGAVWPLLWRAAQLEARRGPPARC
jgi:hypothetical protein